MRCLLVLVLLAGCNHEKGGPAPADLAPAAPCDPDPCGGGQECVAMDGRAMCRCPAGTHEDGTTCVPDDSCTPTTCSGHGTCASATLACACDPGFAGTHCEGCDSGWFSDGHGGCTTDPCSPNPCTGANQTCVAQSGAAVCSCLAGTHDVNGKCTPDQTCMPASCSGHGTCSDGSGQVSCFCATGYSGSACQECDLGWHSDGAGGCTQDLCTPNPCVDLHKSVCAAGECGCDPGYHAAGMGCAADETCDADSCHGHGACSLTGGVAGCVCAAGYVGARCDGCDTGYHDDGAGGCSNNPCTPNPCAAPHKTVCTPQGADGVCGCDADYHGDGTGGCTNDPCTPNPCAAQNQACRVQTGAAVCFTPVCDDSNPCTDDSLVGGVCQHAPRADGSTCSTSLCQVGETCSGGACGGGSARVCNDGNPCTKDSCNPLSGCAAANDNTLVPSDGIDCTVDTCSGGASSHVAQNALCSDGLWCDGVEVCQPGAGADLHGCRATQVPAAPLLAQNGCSHYRCDEMSQSFVLDRQSAGTPCSDGIACTTGDQCRADGSCGGTLLAGCPGAGCQSSSALGGTIDIPIGNVSGTVSFASGAMLPGQSIGPNAGSSIYFYLVAHDTGTEQLVNRLSFDWQSGNTYNLSASSIAAYSTRLVPGIYDVLYERDWSSSTDSVGKSDSSDAYVNGRRLLRSGVVVGTGANKVDIDVPVANLSGTLKMNGSSTLPPQSIGPNAGSSVYIYLVAQDSGARQLVNRLSFDWQSGNTYNLSASSSAAYATKLVPGTYDVLYERDFTTSTNSTGKSDTSDSYANGRRVLQTGVVLGAGDNTLDVELGATTVSGSFKMNGSSTLPPQSIGPNAGSSVYVYLVAKDTGAEQLINRLSFDWQTGNTYNLSASSSAAYATRVLPGSYDLLYERDWSSSTNSVGKSDAGDSYVNGRRYLQRDVVVGAAPLQLDVELGATAVSGTLKMHALDTLPAQSIGPNAGSSIYVYLVAQDTGTRQLVNRLSFDWQTGNTYNLSASSAAAFATRVLPGTYDVLYERDWNSSTNSVGKSDDTDAYYNGLRFLQKDVLIAGTDPVMQIQIGGVDLGGALTVSSGALPAQSIGPNAGSSVYVYLVAKDTGVEQLINRLSFDWQSGNTYNLSASSKAAWSTRVLPGSYDVLYERDWNSSTDSVGKSDDTDAYVNGRRILATNVVISADRSLPIDLPATGIAGTLTVAGAAPPASSVGPNAGSSNYIYLVARDTGAKQLLSRMSFDWQSGNTYALSQSSPAAFSTRAIPGVYDLQVERDWNSSTDSVGKSDAGDPWVNARRDLGICIAIP